MPNDFEEGKLSNIPKEEKITFFLSKSQLRELIKTLGYQIDEQGVIVNSEGEPMVSTDGDEIKLDKIGLLLPANSPHKFVKNNLGSLSQFLAEREG